MYFIYALKNHFKKVIILSVVLIIFFILIKRKQKKTKLFFKVFRNLPEKFPQAFIKNDDKFVISSNEEVCRKFLERTFKRAFPKSRPSFLKNPETGKRLELDCYCEKLKLACEYNGQQHYRYTPYFHKNFESFRNQQFRDNLKKKLCKQNNIYLIEVPYYINNIEEYLKRKLIEWKTSKQKGK